MTHPVRVEEHVTPPVRRWHTVVLRVDPEPFRYGTGYAGISGSEIKNGFDVLDRLRRIAKRIATTAGLKRKSRINHSRHGYALYLFVYQDGGTGEDHDRFIVTRRLAQRAATKLRRVLTRYQRRQLRGESR
jgi:hypothetical protein